MKLIGLASGTGSAIPHFYFSPQPLRRRDWLLSGGLAYPCGLGGSGLAPMPSPDLAQLCASQVSRGQGILLSACGRPTRLKLIPWRSYQAPPSLARCL